MQTTAPAPTRRAARLLLPLSLVALLGAGACADGDEGATGDVATLDAEGGAGTDDDDGDEGGGGQGARQPDPEFQDAMLEFADCMREQGIDMPDPSFEEGGGAVVIGGPAGAGDGPPSEAELEEMEAAQEACRPILEEVEGQLPEIDPEQQAEMQDRALAFAECMREHGIDMPDPDFGEDGRISQSIGGPDGGGIDPGDEDFQEAQEACMEEGGMEGPGVIVGGGSVGGSSSADDGDEG